jgi:hypothetical protein
MRHSTITLTLDRYSHVGLHDTAGAFDKLPALPGSPPAPQLTSMQATGTEGQRISERFATQLPLAGDGPGRSLSDSDVIGESGTQIVMGRKSLEIGELDASGRGLTGPVANSGGGTRTPDTRIMIPLL